MNGIDKPLYDIKAEIVISLCKDKMVFNKNERRNFNAFVKRGDLNHIPTQLAYMYADSVMNSHNTNGDVNEMNTLVKELKEEVAEANVDYESLEDKYHKKVSTLNTEIKNLKSLKKQLEEQQKIIDTLPTDIKKLFHKGPSCFLT